MSSDQKNRHKKVPKSHKKEIKKGSANAMPIHCAIMML